jgi:hypothetical protein
LTTSESLDVGGELEVGSGQSEISQVFLGAGIGTANAGTSCNTHCPATWPGYRCFFALTLGIFAEIIPCDQTATLKDCFCVD